MKRITIDLLSINNFRNCESLKIRFHPEINVITGLNGAGKTSILDAIFYLTNGKSYFTNLDRYIYRTDIDFFRLDGDIIIEGNLFNVQLTSSVEKKKQIKLDDKPLKLITEYFGRFPCFMIAPKDIQILIESSVERRKVIDRTLSQIDKQYFIHLLNYNKLLKQRNATIKSFQKTRQINKLLLEVLDQKLLEPAQYIYNKRKEYFENIAPIFDKYYKEISEDKEQLGVNYRSNLVTESMENLLKQSFEKDLIVGKTTEGIHKDDMVLTINNQDIKKYASQGQLKSAIISLKLSQIEWVKTCKSKIPILLLDDIFDKLDSDRVEHLLRICHNQLQSQIFITDTDADRVTNKLEKLNIDFNHYYITNGKLES